MFRKLPLALFVLLASLLARAETKPLHALIIAGGCWHDYENQPKILSAGIQARSNVQVDVV